MFPSFQSDRVSKIAEAAQWRSISLDPVKESELLRCCDPHLQMGKKERRGEDDGASRSWCSEIQILEFCSWTVGCSILPPDKIGAFRNIKSWSSSSTSVLYVLLAAVSDTLVPKLESDIRGDHHHQRKHRPQGWHESSSSPDPCVICREMRLWIVSRKKIWLFACFPMSQEEKTREDFKKWTCLEPRVSTNIIAIVIFILHQSLNHPRLSSTLSAFRSPHHHVIFRPWLLFGSRLAGMYGQYFNFTPSVRDSPWIRLIVDSSLFMFKFLWPQARESRWDDFWWRFGPILAFSGRRRFWVFAERRARRSLGQSGLRSCHTSAPSSAPPLSIISWAELVHDDLWSLSDSSSTTRSLGRSSFVSTSGITRLRIMLRVAIKDLQEKRREEENTKE